MINNQRLIKLTQDLIRIDSQNPPGDEYRIGVFVKRYFDQLGLKTCLYEFEKRRSNVLAYLAGPGAKFELLITPHLDTVPAGRSWNLDPFKAGISAGKIYGLGATDCKCNLACAMEAINSLVEDEIRLGYNLVFAATADEETGSALGLIPLLRRGILKPDAALVLDSDDFEVIVAQKGLIHLKVKVQGRRAHGAYPERGINAIDIAVDMLKELRKHKFSFLKNKYLKPPTLNVGTIKGGDKVNIVADWCEFELDLRFLPGMSHTRLLKDLKEILARHSRRFRIEIEGIQRPYMIDAQHNLVKCLVRAMAKIGKHRLIKGSEGATTITFFQDKHIPAIATGFGTSGCAHIADEYVKIDTLYKGARVLEGFLKNYCF